MLNGQEMGNRSRIYGYEKAPISEGLSTIDIFLVLPLAPLVAAVIAVPVGGKGAVIIVLYTSAPYIFCLAFRTSSLIKDSWH